MTEASFNADNSAITPFSDSDERFRTLANAAFEGILIHLEGIIVDANEQVAKIIGLPLDMIVGRSIYDLVSEEVRTTLVAQLSVKSKNKSYELRGKRADGSRLFLEVRSREITYKNERMRVAVIRDITERKKTEDDLRKSEQEVRRILANMHDTFYRTDLQGTVLFASPSAYKLLQLREDEALGVNMADMYVNPGDRKIILDELAKNDGRVTQVRSLLKRKDGTHIWVWTNAQYYYDGEGRLAGVEGVARDITQLIEAEENVQNALKEAEEASRAKGEFLAVMSHEIRTPLNGLLTTAQLFAKTKLDEEQERYLETIASSGKLLYTLLNDILDLSKLDAGKFQLECSDFELCRTLSSVVQQAEALAKNKDLDFKTEFDVRAPLYLKGDPLRLQQVVLNLLSNAVKFTERGEVKFSVTVFASSASYLVELVVSDTGIGIPKSDQEKIFQPFEQGDASITRRFGGSGLGLAITRELVALMGGTVKIASEEHAGTQCTLMLPYAVGNESPSEEETDSLIAPQSFLLVDDEPVNRSAMGALLESDGHRVTLATDGFHALEILQRQEFDYLLIDIHMPKMDGIETVRRWKNTLHGARSSTRIIALTADTRRETVARSQEAGMLNLLPKPFMKMDLYAIVQQQRTRSHALACGSQSLIDATYVEMICADIGTDKFITNTALFKTHGQDSIAKLKACLQAGDSEGGIFWAHRLAGSSRMVGMTGLAGAASVVEVLTREKGEAVEMDRALRQLVSLYEQSVLELGQWLSRREAEGASVFEESA